MLWIIEIPVRMMHSNSKECGIKWWKPNKRKFGDSHFGGCTLKINNYLKTNFVTIGFVKPGTDNFTLTTTIRKTTQKPTHKYETVFWIVL
jgi:hypothetical protein